jgi:hypothetical protein
MQPFTTLQYGCLQSTQSGRWAFSPRLNPYVSNKMQVGDARPYPEEKRMAMRFGLMILVGLFSTTFTISAYAQNDPAYSYTGDSLVSGVRLIDGLGNAPVENQDILIVDGKIAAIGPAGSIDAPADAMKIDGAGMTAMPGLIDMYIHLKGGWTGGNAMPEKYSAGRTDPELQQTLSAFLYSGVTTVLDVGNPTVWIAKQRDRINQGELLGPRTMTGSTWRKPGRSVQLTKASRPTCSS